MELWLNVTLVEIEELVPMARAAEESGFTGMTMGDHLVFPKKITSPYPYSAEGGAKWRPSGHWPDVWVAIAAMATATTTLRFTPGVYIAPLRDPFSLAKSLSTVARLSGDRVIAGLGAGWMKEEFDVMGTAFEARGARMDEMIEVMRLLWTGEMVEFHGRFYDFSENQMGPAPLTPIPIYIGGHSGPALRRAIRNDGWIGVHHKFEETAALIAKLRELQSDAPDQPGRPIMMAAGGLSADDVARFAELGADAVVLSARTLEAEPGPQGRLDAIRRAGEDLCKGRSV